MTNGPTGTAGITPRTPITLAQSGKVFQFLTRIVNAQTHTTIIIKRRTKNNPIPRPKSSVSSSFPESESESEYLSLFLLYLANAFTIEDNDKTVI